MIIIEKKRNIKTILNHYKESICYYKKEIKELHKNCQTRKCSPFWLSDIEKYENKIVELEIKIKLLDD